MCGMCGCIEQCGFLSAGAKMIEVIAIALTHTPLFPGLNPWLKRTKEAMMMQRSKTLMTLSGTNETG